MESKIMDDIEEYKTTVFFGLTVRQALLGGTGVVVVAAVYFLSCGAMGAGTAGYISILLGLPCFLLGFYRPQNMALEKYIAMVVKSELLSHRFRVYRCENMLYRFIEEENKRKMRSEIFALLKKIAEGVRKCQTGSPQ